MAIHLTPLVLVLFCCGQAMAQGSATVADPTRPPAAFSGGVTVTGEAAADAGGSRLRSVKLPKRGKPSAVIDGKVVYLGGKIGDSKLTRITENEAVLTSQTGKETLYLTPDVSKKPVAGKTARQRKKETP